MKLKRRLWVYVSVVLSGILIFFLYRYIGSRLWGLTYPWNSFLFDEGDRFMDFFNVNDMVSGLNPYGNGSSYPPLANLFAYLISLLIPGTGVDKPAVIRDFFAGGRWVLFGMYAFCLLFMVVAIWRRLIPALREEEQPGDPGNSRRGRKIGTVALLLATALSLPLAAPVIYSLDRGNYLILCTLFLFLFCMNYGKHDIFAAVCLAIAACLKIYPLALFFLFLRDKKWKPLAAGLSFGAVATLAPVFLFQGAILANLKSFAGHLLAFSGGAGPYDSFYYRFGVGIRNLIGTFCYGVLGHIPTWLHISKLSLLIGGLLLIGVVVLCIFEKRTWRQMLYLSLFMILFPSPSFYYNLTYLLGPIFFFLLKREREKNDLFFAIALGLLMAPKSYYFILAHFSNCDQWISIDCFINPFLMCLILLVGAVEVIRSAQKARSLRLQAPEANREAIAP